MKKKIVALLAVSLLTALSGCGKTQETASVAETAPVTQAQTEALTETESQTESESAPETTNAETLPETTESESDSVSESETIQMDGLLSHDGIVKILSETFQEKNMPSEVSYDDAQQSYVIASWEDGLGELCDKYNNFSEGWNTVRNSALESYQSYCDMLHELDSQSGVILHLVDDRNHENKILSVQNYQIIYDIMNEKSPEDFRKATVDSLNQQFAESGKNAQAVYSESEQAYIVSTWYDGLGEKIESKDIDSDKWNQQKDLFRVMYDSIRAILQSSSDNTTLILKVVDDRNHEKDLVIIKNSEIIYDILA